MSANDENIVAAKNDNLQISNLSLRFLFLFLANVGIGNSMLFAVLPRLGRILKLPDWSISTIHSVSALLWVVTSPFWGRASDKFGRKPMILLGLIVYALPAIFLALAATIGIYSNLRWEFKIISMIIARTVYGAFGSATNPAAQAYVADGSLPQNRNMGPISFSSNGLSCAIIESRTEDTYNFIHLNKMSSLHIASINEKGEIVSSKPFLYNEVGSSINSAQMAFDGTAIYFSFRQTRRIWWV